MVTGKKATPSAPSAGRVTVRSVNGPAVTTLRGLNGGTHSIRDSVRCVYIAQGRLAGFTLSGFKVRADYSLEETWTAEVDLGQLAQVIQNLVINAREAIRETQTVFD